MGARTDGRPRAARTRLGVAARQSLRFADLAAALSPRPGSAARFRRGVGRRRHAWLDLRAARRPDLQMAKRRSGLRPQARGNPARVGVSSGRGSRVCRYRRRDQSCLLANGHPVPSDILCRTGSGARLARNLHSRRSAVISRPGSGAGARRASRRYERPGGRARCRSASRSGCGSEAATLHGRFLDIDQHGALLLEAAGEIRRISAGEIFPANR